MIEVKNVTKSFDSVKAVAGISFSTKPGEIFGLIGPNGAGKSTTIRMIMNIIAPDSGSILFDGKPIVEEDKERIGYLPEERGLYKKVKVNDMLLYLGELKGREKTFLQKNSLVLARPNQAPSKRKQAQSSMLATACYRFFIGSRTLADSFIGQPCFSRRSRKASSKRPREMASVSMVPDEAAATNSL